jgi:hypothetical protein
MGESGKFGGLFLPDFAAGRPDSYNGWMRAMHDMGGLPAGPVEKDEHDPSLAERRVDALMSLLMSPAVAAFNVDEMRRTIESLPREVYERHDYYERWLLTIESLLVEKGLLTRAEIGARIAALEADAHD